MIANKIFKVLNPQFEQVADRSRLSLVKDLALLFSSDAKTYNHCIKSTLKIEAEVEAAKARIEYIGRVTRLRVARETKCYLKRS